MKFFRKNVVTVLAAAAVLCAGAVVVANRLGQRAAAADIEVLKVLWPDIKTVPIEDRVLVAEASYRCKLRNVPPLPETVKNCLRNGARQLESKNPETHAAQRLESLFATAKR